MSPEAAEAIASTVAKKLSGGIETLLDAGARVLYEKLFSTRHVGRVIDFVVFESRAFIDSCADSGFVEYRIRHIAELAIFNAWSNFRKADRARCVELEFGADKSRFIFTVSYYAEGDLRGFAPGATPANATSSRTQAMLLKIQELSDGIVIRHDPKAARVQVVAFVSHNEGEKVTGSEYLIAADSDTDAAASAEVSDERPAPEALSKSQIESFLTDEAAAQSSEMAIAPAASDVKVDHAVKIEGTTEKIKDEMFVVKGSRESAPESNLLRVKRLSAQERELEPELEQRPGSAPMGEGPLLEESEAGSLIQATFNDTVTSHETSEAVELILNAIRSEIVPVCRQVPPDQLEGAFSKSREDIAETLQSSLKHILKVKSIQLVSRLKQLQNEVELVASQLSDARSENVRLGSILAEASRAGKVPETFTVPVFNSDSEKVQDDETSTKGDDAAFQRKMAQFRESVEQQDMSDPARGLAKGILETVLKDRAELSDRMRSFQKLIRKRDHDMKTQETKLREELRVVAAQLKQRDFALEKTKEALSRASSSLETQKQVTTEGSSEAAELQTRLVTAERKVQSLQELNLKIQRRADELMAKMQEEIAQRTSLQQNLGKYTREADELRRKVAEFESGRAKNNSLELIEMTRQRDRGLKAIEELKGQLKELQQKIIQLSMSRQSSQNAADAKKGPTLSEAEMRHKIEQANTMVRAMKDELERTRKRLDEVQLKESNQKVELSKLQIENTKLQTQIKSLSRK